MRSCSIVLVLSFLAGSPTAQASKIILKQGSITVRDDATVHVGGKRLSSIALPPPPRRIEVLKPRIKGKRLLWIRIHGAEGRGSELLYAGETLLFTGSTGPQGVDGEWSRHLQVNASGVLLYQQRPGVTRCGHRTDVLFPQRYDFTAKRFRHVFPPRAAGKVKELQATRMKGPLHEEPLNTFFVSAASSHRGDGREAANLAPAVEAVDGRLETAWSLAGASSRGAFLTLRRPPSPYPLVAIALVPGDAGSEQRFRAAGRVKTLLLEFDGGLRYRLRIPQDPARSADGFRGPFRANLPKPYTGQCLSITVEEHYPGREKHTLALAEFRPITTLSMDSGALTRLVKDLQHEDSTRSAVATRILIRQGARGVPALASAAKNAAPRAREKIIETLARLRSPEAARVIFAHVPHLSVRLRKRIAPTLLALGANALPLIKPLTLHKRAPLRHYGFRLLGMLGNKEAHGLLLDRVGIGSPQERKAVVQALGLRGSARLTSALLLALTKATQPAQRADLVLLLGRHTHTATQKTVVDALLALWPTTSDFEVHIRLISALSRLDAKRAKTLLLKELESKDPILRWRALYALRRIPAALSQAKASELLADADPRVREEASMALRVHRQGKVTAALTQRLLNDRWPQVARKAAIALSGRCEKLTLTRMRQAVRKRGFGIDALALRNIVACQPKWLLIYLLRVAAEPRQPTSLRRLAVDVVPADLLKRHLRHIKRFFLNIRREALTSSAAEKVTATLAESMGRSRHLKMAPLLADALALDPSPLIRASAARALGYLCDAKVARPPLQRAVKDPSPLVAGAAQATLAKCGAN
ncbi:MAG: HEAT repeat domain-containing protein [Deltaproteobacteria bacterium]|nr:HEAT repeat domain-containing protein [Deltaproteobacteria bacterium]